SATDRSFRAPSQISFPAWPDRSFAAPSALRPSSKAQPFQPVRFAALRVHAPECPYPCLAPMRRRRSTAKLPLRSTILLFSSRVPPLDAPNFSVVPRPPWKNVRLHGRFHWPASALAHELSHHCVPGSAKAPFILEREPWRFCRHRSTKTR